MIEETWIDNPILDRNQGHTRTIGAATNVFGTIHYFYGFIFSFRIANNDLWHRNPVRRRLNQLDDEIEAECNANT